MSVLHIDTVNLLYDCRYYLFKNAKIIIGQYGAGLMGIYPISSKFNNFIILQPNSDLSNSKKWDKLIELNVYIIKHIANLLEIELPIQKSSEFNFVNKKTELLIEMCQKINADIYLSGEGGRAYVDDTKFQNNNLKNYFTNFKHPVYKQLIEPFIPNMSTVDLLLNHDLKTSKKIIEDSGIIGE